MPIQIMFPDAKLCTTYVSFRGNISSGCSLFINHTTFVHNITNLNYHC